MIPLQFVNDIKIDCPGDDSSDELLFQGIFEWFFTKTS